jgi:hypothetical protein
VEELASSAATVVVDSVVAVVVVVVGALVGALIVLVMIEGILESTVDVTTVVNVDDCTLVLVVGAVLVYDGALVKVAAMLVLVLPTVVLDVSVAEDVDDFGSGLWPVVKGLVVVVISELKVVAVVEVEGVTSQNDGKVELRL